MNDDNLTLEILRQIRDEARATNERLDATNERLDATTERLDARLDNLTEAMVRGFTLVNDRLGQVHDRFGDVNERLDALLLGSHRDEHHDLRERIERIEAWVGLD